MGKPVGGRWRRERASAGGGITKSSRQKAAVGEREQSKTAIGGEEDQEAAVAGNRTAAGGSQSQLQRRGLYAYRRSRPWR